MAELSETPSASRTRITFFGRRNAGKSSLLNALAGQPVAIVSSVPGTTADPVSKAMEMLPLGPVLLTDTAGLDDEGALGEKRMEKSFAALAVADIAVLCVAADSFPLSATEKSVLEQAKSRGVRTVLAVTQIDRCEPPPASLPPDGMFDAAVRVSSATREGIDTLLATLSAMAPSDVQPPLVADLVSPGDIAVCVCPIDSAAPKGRLILPQQQVVRELLDAGAAALVCRETELAGVLDRLAPAKPSFVITDSQAFAAVDAVVPPDVPLTSFSIVFARAKGDLALYCGGAAAVDSLKDGDKVLICEGCTHRKQCGDIGTVKLPRWIEKRSGAKLSFDWCAGSAFPQDLSPYALVVHCGGCMLPRREVQNRLRRAAEQGVKITNYGTAIAHVHGIDADPSTRMVVRRRT